MQAESIPMDRTLRSINAQMAGQASVVDRLQGELARAKEIHQQKERELRSILEKVVAQEKLATLGQLAASAAHEISQPLFYLRIFCDSIINDRLAERLHAPELGAEAKEACRQITRIQTITRQMLRFAHPAEESFVPHDLPAALAQAMLLMAPQLKRHGVTLSETRGAALAPILGSAGMLEQLFVNLLQNAIDALAGQERKEIHIRFSRHKEQLAVNFRDNGPGVPEAVRARIFEPFFTTKGKGQGTGLGLAICADIIRGHHGTIRLNTKSGVGTEFIMRFPVLGKQTERADP